MADARLHVTDRAGRRVVAIDQSPFTLGRGIDQDLQLTGGEVSRAHAEIRREGERYVLHDSASRYGTFVGGEPVQERVLVEGDRIQLGRSAAVELVFLEEPDTAGPGQESLVEAVRQTAVLLEGLRALGAGHLLNDVLLLVLDAAIGVSGADRGFIMLATADGVLEFTFGRGAGRISLPGQRFKISRKIPEEVFATGEPRIVADLVDDVTADAHGETLALGIRQVLCVPLKLTRFLDRPGAAPEPTRIGVLYLDSQEKGALLSDTVRVGVETLATEAAVAIENARLYRQAVEKARVDQELRIAAEMQKALRPPARHVAPTFEIVAASQSSRSISGDFFHYMSMADGAFGFALGDVSGKGPPAAVLGAAVQGMFAAYAESEGGPAQTLTRVNATLSRNFADARFATLAYCMIWPDGRLMYSNAGHNPPMLFTGGMLRRLDAGGVPLGLFPDAAYEQETLQLIPGDVLVVFSDGVSETENLSGEIFGDEGIVAAASGALGLEPQALLDRLLAAAEAFRMGQPPQDDVTAMTLRYRG